MKDLYEYFLKVRQHDEEKMKDKLEIVDLDVMKKDDVREALQNVEIMIHCGQPVK